MKKRFLFSFPQSSQVFGTESFFRDNPKKARKELFASYQEVETKHHINRNQVTIVSASQEGKLAIELALKENEIPSKGFTDDKDFSYPEVKEFYSGFKNNHLSCKPLLT